MRPGGGTGVTRTRSHRLAQATIDASAWVLAFSTAALSRADFDLDAVPWHTVLLGAAIAAGTQLLLGALLGLYRGRYVYGSFEEVLGVVLTGAGVAIVLAFVAVQTGLLTRGRALVVTALAVLIMLGIRYVIRQRSDRRRRPGQAATPVVVFGAGSAGHLLVRSIQTDPASPYRVVALLDDDPAKSHLRIMGVPVRGGRGALERIVLGTGAKVLVVGIANVDAALLRELNTAAGDLGLDVKVVPTTARLVDGIVDVFDLRDLDETDLLGRRQVSIDMAEVSNLIRGRRVLITGAGGSIGSELARQVHALAPSALLLLDRDENGLHRVSLELYGRALLDDDTTALASIRDGERLLHIFRSFQPDIVFHAAALKHLPLLESHPSEGVKTNVFGTLNVLRAAQAVGVDVFVNISTDKAADPVSVLGYTKRITERLTASFAAESNGTYVSVRFGNVLASAGSVLHSFAAQINAGGPVTVTHPEITRYFMTIPEAVQLVLQAVALGDDGEVLVLDMGDPVRIADVAHELIRNSGKQIEVVYTGLRDGEKLHERLLAPTEHDRRPRHDLVSQVPVPPLERSALRRLDTAHTEDEIRDALAELARIPAIPEPRPNAAAPSQHRDTQSVAADST